VGADPQPSIEPQRLALVGAVEAGEERVLPTLTVTNAGDAAGTFVVGVRSFADPGATPPEAAWLRLEPAEFELTPGESRTVTITVAPDSDAEAQSYRTLVTAGTREGELAVAATLEFGVEAAAGSSFASVDPVVVGGVVGAVALILALVLLVRRLQFDIGAIGRQRDVVAVAAGTAEPSRSVLLDAPPELERATLEAAPPPTQPESSRPWLTDFSEATFERPARPSMDHPAQPLAQLPAHSPLQVPFPPPFQPSLPPPPVEEPVATVEPLDAARSAPATRPRRRLDWLTAGSFALGASLALWAAVATWMLATQPEVDRGAVDARIAALEARIEAMTAELTSGENASTPLETAGQVATAEAGAPPSDDATPLSLAAVPTTAAEEPQSTPEAEPVETQVPDATSEPAPLATSQAIENEAAPPEETAVPGGETWNVGPDGERIYFAGPGGGPLDTAGQDLYDCHHFETWAQALAVREASGPGDPNLIDVDGNGLPCESLMAREQAG